MTNKRAKKSALNTLFQNKLYSLDDYSDLQRIIESNKFVIIEYKKHSNSKHVAELIKRLKIENEIELSDSFIYIKSNLRFVFIHAGVSDEDKYALLRQVHYIPHQKL